MLDPSIDVADRLNLSPSRREQLARWKRAWARFSNSPVSILGLVIILLAITSAVLAPVLAPYPSHKGSVTNLDERAEPPSKDHLFGTDLVGRDILSRMLFGARLSLGMGVVVLSIAISIGVSLGLIAGYLGGWVNAVIMRVTDIFLSIPPILLAMAVVAALGPSLLNAMIAVSLAWWPWYTRLVQGEVLSIKNEGYVEASEAVGANWLYISFREVLPNTIAPITVKGTIDLGFVILVAAALGFLGLGAQSPTPELGLMIAKGRAEISTFWWISTMPGLMISFIVLGFNLLGDGIRDMFDVEVDPI